MHLISCCFALHATAALLALQTATATTAGAMTAAAATVKGKGGSQVLVLPLLPVLTYMSDACTELLVQLPFGSACTCGLLQYCCCCTKQACCLILNRAVTETQCFFTVVPTCSKSDPWLCYITDTHTMRIHR